MTSRRTSLVPEAITSIGDAHGIDAQAIAAAHRASRGIARWTPSVAAVNRSAEMDPGVLLKAENLQLTGSYKLRGALNKVRSLGVGCRGVVAASAGNHAQGLAYAARAVGVRCGIYLPTGAPRSKVEAIRELGADIHQEAATVDECFALAAAAAERHGWALVHPFDDPDVIVGQGGVGVELLADVPELSQVVLPVGGGGLAAGVAVAIKSVKPEVRVIGVQAPASAPFVEPSYPPCSPGASSVAPIADGVAVKRPGLIGGAVIEKLLDDLVIVQESEVADAMIWVMEHARMVAEGAGAVAVAALIHGHVAPAAQGDTVAVISGGNVDVSLLAAVVRRHESRERRRIRLVARVADSPGSLAALLNGVAGAGGNLIELNHVRDGLPMAVREAVVELTVETAGAAASDALLASLRNAGFVVSESS